MPSRSNRWDSKLLRLIARQMSNTAGLYCTFRFSHMHTACGGGCGKLFIILLTTQRDILAFSTNTPTTHELCLCLHAHELCLRFQVSTIFAGRRESSLFSGPKTLLLLQTQLDLARLRKRWTVSHAGIQQFITTSRRVVLRARTSCTQSAGCRKTHETYCFLRLGEFAHTQRKR